MEVREAIDIAKRYVADLFASEGLVDARLEEVALDEGDDIWSITIGMVRPLPSGKLDQFFSQIAELRGEIAGPRVYRVVRVRNRDGKVLSVKIREEVD